MANHHLFNLAMLMSVGLLSQHSHAATPQGLSSFATSWAGSFDGRKIGFFIESIQQDKVSGYSLLGATRQSFLGTIEPQGANSYKLIATETGSPATAGVFELILNISNASAIEGSWQSRQGNVKPKFFSLSKQQCTYNPKVGDYPQSSTRLLKDDDLQTSKNELQYMRNEIYARHHYSFANKEIAGYFAEADWYIPCSLDVSRQLTKIEQENIKRIKLMEPYAENVDSEWGR